MSMNENLNIGSSFQPLRRMEKLLFQLAIYAFTNRQADVSINAPVCGKGLKQRDSEYNKTNRFTLQGKCPHLQ